MEGKNWGYGAGFARPIPPISFYRFMLIQLTKEVCIFARMTHYTTPILLKT